MSVRIADFKAFETVLRCRFAGRGVADYRIVHVDLERRAVALFDLTCRGSSLRRLFVVRSMSELESLPDDACEVVDDVYTLPRAKLTADKLNWKIKRWWVGRWQKIRALVSLRYACAELLAGHRLTDLYIDPDWRYELIGKQAVRLGLPRARVEKELVTFVRYGGTLGALIPQTDRCGAPGQPKCLLPRARKPGRRTAAQRRLQGKLPPRNRFDPFWNQRMTDAINGLVSRDGDRAFVAINCDRDFLDYFYSHHCCVLGATDGRERHTVDPRKIPSRRTLLRHRDRIMRSRPELTEVSWAAFANVRGGAAKDLTFDVLDIADLDGTVFPEVCLLVADDESLVASRKNCPEIGEPTVLIGFCRRTGAAVGWYVTAGPETGDAYRFCLFNILTSKSQRLTDLGLDPADFPGIVSGSFDLVVFDCGPGRSHKVLEWTTERIKIDVRFARAGVPPDKGPVEGGIGLLKEYLRRNHIIADLLKTAALDRLSAFPKGVVTLQRLRNRHAQRRAQKKPKRIYVTSKAFERILVEAVNELNLTRKSESRCLSEEMQFAGVEPTPISMLYYYQSLRRGNAAYPRSDQDMRESLLERKSCIVRNGKIKLGGLFYGSPSSVPEGEEGADELLRFAREVAEGASPKIDVVVEPYRNYVWWRRHERDWLLLAPDRASADHCHIERDWIDRQALRDHESIQAARAYVKGVSKKIRGLNRAADRERGRILRAQVEQTFAGPIHVDGAAYRQVIAQEKIKNYLEFSTAAGVPGLPNMELEETPRPGGTFSLSELFEDHEAGIGDIDEETEVPPK